MITVAEVASTRPCPEPVCFVRVDNEPLFLCRDAAGLTIAATAQSSIRAGELAGPSQLLVHTGEPWDDVVISGASSRLVLTGVRAAEIN